MGPASKQGRFDDISVTSSRWHPVSSTTTIDDDIVGFFGGGSDANEEERRQQSSTVLLHRPAMRAFESNKVGGPSFFETECEFAATAAFLPSGGFDARHIASPNETLVSNMNTFVTGLSCVATSRRDPVPMTKYDGVREPKISMPSYLCRLYENIPEPAAVCLCAMVYMDRLVSLPSATICMTHRNSYRIVLTGTLLAMKYISDEYYENSHVAKLGGVPISELNALELDFALRVGFDFSASENVVSMLESRFSAVRTVKALLQN